MALVETSRWIVVLSVSRYHTELTGNDSDNVLLRMSFAIVTGTLFVATISVYAIVLMYVFEQFSEERRSRKEGGGVATRRGGRGGLPEPCQEFYR